MAHGLRVEAELERDRAQAQHPLGVVPGEIERDVRAEAVTDEERATDTALVQLREQVGRHALDGEPRGHLAAPVTLQVGRDDVAVPRQRIDQRRDLATGSVRTVQHDDR